MSFVDSTVGKRFFWRALHNGTLKFFEFSFFVFIYIYRYHQYGFKRLLKLAAKVGIAWICGYGKPRTWVFLMSEDSIVVELKHYERIVSISESDLAGRNEHVTSEVEFSEDDYDYE